jgi:hypothetical protein
LVRRNFLRSLCAAWLVVAASGGVLLAGAVPPAGAVDNNQWTVWVRDDGFSQVKIDARAGDRLTFQLDPSAQQSHTLVWDNGDAYFQFSRPDQESVTYPLNNPGKATFYDWDHVRGPNRAAFVGTLTVSDAGAPPPPDPSSTSTTVTTAPASTTTTTAAASPGPAVPSTTTFPATTATTGYVTIHPFLVQDPIPATTTTTAARNNPADDKGKAKAAAPDTATTGAPPPTDPSVFDSAALTPPPLPQPQNSGPAVPSPPADLDVSASASLLHPDGTDGADTALMLLALGAVAMFVVAGGAWRWHHRASRYIPA